VTLAGGGSASVVNDFYQFGRLAYQTNGAGALLATYTYDERGAPVSAQVGSSSTSPRYYYVYDARGDVVNLTDASGAVVATYSYDTWGNLLSASESIPNANGWSNPFRFDGRDSVQFDATTGLDWMATRAYDPTTGRFISRDPLGRVPLFLASSDNPYVYAGNNPLSNVDPSGQFRAAGFGSTARESGQATNQQMARVVTQSGCGSFCKQAWEQSWLNDVNNLRNAHLRALQIEAAGFALVAAFAQAFGGLVDFLTEGTLGKLEGVVIIATWLVAALTYAGMYFGGGSLYEKFAALAGAISYVGGLALTVIGAYQLMSWAAQFSVQAALLSIQAVIGGVPAVLEELGSKILGGALLFLANGFAAQYVALYNATNVEAEREQEMSPDEWCKAFTSLSC